MYLSPFLGCGDPHLAPRWRALLKGVIVTHVGLSPLLLIQGREVIVDSLSSRLEDDASSDSAGPQWPVSLSQVLDAVSLTRQRLSFPGSRCLWSGRGKGTASHEPQSGWPVSLSSGLSSFQPPESPVPPPLCFAKSSSCNPGMALVARANNNKQISACWADRVFWTYSCVYTAPAHQHQVWTAPAHDV